MFQTHKRLIVGGITALVIISVLLVAFVKRGSFNSPSTNKGTSSSAPIRLNNEEIASRLLRWMNDNRTDNGGYSEGEVCVKGTCEAPVLDNRIGAFGLWARYRSYAKTKGFESMAIMSQDIHTYTDPNKVVTIQPHFWNCKLLLELWKSSAFTQDQKDDIQIICARAVYNTFDLTFPEGAQLEETAKLQVVQEADGKRLSDELVFLEPVDKTKLFEYAASASERVGMFEWAADKEDLRQAHLFLMGAVEAFRLSDTATQGEYAPVVGIAALDLNRVNPSPAFANYADYLFKKYKTSSCGSIENCALRVYFYHELYKQKKTDAYRIERDKTIQALYDEKFDYESLKGYRLGKGVFYDAQQKDRYWTVANAILAGVLLDM